MAATAAEVRHVQDALPRIISRHGGNYNALDWDELESLALVGLARAAVAFDPQRGLKFSTLATTCICREWGRAVYLGKMKMRRPPAPLVSLDECPPGYEKTPRRDLLADPHDCFAGIHGDDEPEIDAERLLEPLPEQLATAARLRWLDGLTYREVGERTGVSHETARKRLKRAAALVRQGARAR